jgi:type I restriction enzyme S subunit
MVRARSNRDLIRLGVSGAEGMANNLPSGVIKALHLPRLSEHEQQDMMKAVATCEGHVQSMIEALERSIELLTEYKQSLITAAVTGELDVTTAGSGIPA